MISTAFSLLGAKNLRSFGKGSIKSGIFTIIIFVAVVLFVVYLPQIVDMVKPPNIGAENFLVDAFIKDFTRSVSSSPLQGEYVKNFTIPVQANIKIQWGFEIGMYLFLVAAIIKIIGGVLAMIVSKDIKGK